MLLCVCMCECIHVSVCVHACAHAHMHMWSCTTKMYHLCWIIYMDLSCWAAPGHFSCLPHHSEVCFFLVYQSYVKPETWFLFHILYYLYTHIIYLHFCVCAACVCMCVCVCVCMHVCACMHTCVHVRAHIGLMIWNWILGLFLSTLLGLPYHSIACFFLVSQSYVIIVYKCNIGFIYIIYISPCVLLV